MNIILFTKHSKKPACVNINQRKILGLSLLFLVLLPATLIYGGYEFGKYRAQKEIVPGYWETKMMQNRKDIEELSRNAQENMNALAQRLGELQAQTIRLNALGKRLVEVAKLDKGEFDFSLPPGQGGPVVDAESMIRNTEVPDFLKMLDQLAMQIDDNEGKLSVLEFYFMNNHLQDEVVPSGRPATSGWVSSYFGMRADPFTGHQEHHKGVDFAGKEGSEVITMAAGVVTWSGDRYGYGNMVEVNHGNGYVTRYGHNKENLVKMGDTVKKGQALALMGSSGRSTGPHVHVEVLYKGKVVDPAKYLYAVQ